MSGTIRESFNKHDDEGGSFRPDRTRQKSGIQYDSDEGSTHADPSDVIQKFREAKIGNSERFNDLLPDLPLPGHGGKKETCGDPIPRGCTDCGKVTKVGNTCYRSRCPRCWKGWDKRRATMITAKLEALRRYRESKRPGWAGWKFHHLVLSPPDGYAMDSDDPLGRTFDLLKEVLGEIGVDTGALFYHPYRGKDGDDRGFWKHLLPDGEQKGMDEMREEIEYSPHFHGVVLSKFVETEHVVGAVEEATGWTIHRITKSEESDVSIFNDYDLARTVSYSLSHTGIGENRAAYRYFGEVANFTAEEQIQREMDARVRSVGTDTLGLKYSSEACQVDRDKTKTRTIERYEEKVNLGAAHGSGSPELVVIEEEIEEQVTETCDGRLVHVGAFPKFLNNQEWMEKAEHAEEMEEAYQNWKDADNLPDPAPWDSPPG